MPIYTLCSTNPDKYEEILVTLPKSSSGVSECEIQILSLCSLFNVELLNENDYLLLEIDNNIYQIYAHSTSRLSLDLMKDYLEAWFEYYQITGFSIKINPLNQLELSHNLPFKIHAMTYNFKMATGFYYLGGEYGSINGFPVMAEPPKGEIGGKYMITSKAVPFTASSPTLFLLSNTGGKCYRMNVHNDTIQNGSIGMVIHNSFVSGGPIIALQGDITSRCASSDLTQIRITLVDCNMHPLKLLNPMFCTISVQEIAEYE